jgi:hypothetical protein
MDITPAGRKSRIYVPKPTYFVWCEVIGLGKGCAAEIRQRLQDLLPDVETNTVIVDRPNTDVEFFAMLKAAADGTNPLSEMDSDLRTEILNLYKIAGCELTNGNVLDLGNAPDAAKARLAAVLRAAHISSQEPIA